MPEGEQEVEVLLLLLARRGGHDQACEGVHLLEEQGHVGQVLVLLQRGAPRGERDAAQTRRAALTEQVLVIAGILAHGDLGILTGRHQVLRQELEHQREVHVHCPLELRQGPDVPGGLLEVGVLLEPARGDDLPQQVDDPLALAGDLHLGDRVEQQEAAVVLGRTAEVVGAACRVQLHGQQARVGVCEHAAHMREGRHLGAVENTVVRVGHGFVEGVLADADARPAEVDLADVDRGQRGVPRRLAGVQDVRLGDRVVVQRERRHVHLVGDDVLLKFVLRRLGVDQEEHVLVGVGELAEHAQPPGNVAIADVVLRPVGHPAVLCGRENHVGRVDIGTVRLLGQAEPEDRPGLEQFADELLGLLVLAHPHRAQPEHGDLPGVPVGQGVEAQDLVQVVDPGGVPPRALATHRRRGAERGEDPLLGVEVEEVLVPRAVVELLLHLGQTLVLEELDQRLELALGLGVVRRRVVSVGIENHGPKVPRGSRPPTGLLVKM